MGLLKYRPTRCSVELILKCSGNLAIDSCAMNLFSFTLNRRLRLALLLLLLAAQGIVNAHDLDDSHAFKADACATCIIGHGLGVAVSVCHDVPQIRLYQVWTPIHAITTTAVSRTQCHHARAPPGSLRT